MKPERRFANLSDKEVIDRLRRALPIRAYPRPPLLAFLAAQGIATQCAPRLLIVDIFEGVDRIGLLCRITLYQAPGDHNFVAPFAQISMDKQHPLGKLFARLGMGSSRTGLP